MAVAPTLFDDAWRCAACTAAPRDSWVAEGASSKDLTTYLDTIRCWFQQLPLTGEDRKHLRNRLESFSIENHIGAVNELSWWRMMKIAGIEIEAIPRSLESTPDFKMGSPADCYVEITTLNISKREKCIAASEDEGVMELDVDEDIRRFLRKSISEKLKQVKYGFLRHKPSLLVIFDYSYFSGFGHQLHRKVDTALSACSLPCELSAIAYVHKFVRCGRITINCNNLRMFLNKSARYQLQSNPLLRISRCRFTKSRKL